MSAGNASTGWNGNVGIDDLGNGSAGNGTYFPMTNVVSLGVPSAELGTVPSKRLDLGNATIVKVPTLHDPGTVVISHELLSTQYARLEAIRKSRAKRSFRINLPVDGGFQTTTVDAFVKKNEIKPATAEEIEMVDTTLDCTGEQT